MADFDPIDLREEPLNDNGSLKDDSVAEQEIIRRIMSRFFRGNTRRTAGDDAMPAE